MTTKTQLTGQEEGCWAFLSSLWLYIPIFHIEIRKSKILSTAQLQIYQDMTLHLNQQDQSKRAWFKEAAKRPIEVKEV